MKAILKKEEQGTNEVVEGYPKVLSTLDNGNLISESIAPNTTIVYQVQIYIPEDLVSYNDNNKIISLNINGVGEVGQNDYNVIFDSDNLLTDIEDTNGDIDAIASMANSDSYIIYSIKDGVITVTNNGRNSSDGYGLIQPIKVYLEKDKNYVFNCETDGVWGWKVGTVEAFLGLNGYFSTYMRMDNNNNFEFTPSTTGTYWLRLDVNEGEKTYKFWNITIKEKIAPKEVVYGKAYGTLPTPTPKEGYTFKGWNGKNLFNANSYIKVYITSNGTIDNSEYDYLLDYYIKVLKSENYTLSANTAFGNMGIAFYDDNKNYLDKKDNYSLNFQLNQKNL